jgi:diphthamide biosynthesis protein 2
LLWYIGDKREQISASMLRLSNYPAVSFSPTSGTVSVSIGSETREFQERYGGVSKVKDAEIIGIIVGSMGLGEGTTNLLIDRLQKLIVASGRKYYTFVMGRLNEAKLCNFPEIDLYCFISNEDEAMIKPKTFHVPVLTPYELELGLGAHDWSAKYLSSSCREYTSANTEELVLRLEGMKVDRIDVDASDCAEQTIEYNSALIRQNDNRELTVFQSAAAVRFLEREYQGLEYKVPVDSDLSVKEGQYGIAASYEQFSAK